jgi:CRP/FNR family nitrogen fixation transcriptional regulator
MTEQSHIKSALRPYVEAPDKPHVLQALDMVATRRHYRRGEEICNSACRSDYLYRVASGAAKRCAALPNGRQQIVDLLLPADIFVCAPNEHRIFTIEAAATETVLACFSRRRVEVLAESDPRVAKLLSGIAFQTVCRLEAQLLILGRTTALEKIGAFLLELSERQSDRANSIVLPVSRYDIADYLGLSVETVSRSLTGLKERGLISFASTRSIKIVDRSALDDARAA